MKDKSALKIVIFIIALNIIILFVYVIFFFNIKKKNEFSSFLVSELKNQAKQEIKLRLAVNNLAETKNEREKLNSYFIQGDENGVVKFMNNIEKLGRVSGLDLKTNSILIKKLKKPVEQMQLNLSLKGKWSDTIYFLKLLEENPYKISFVRFYSERDYDKLKKTTSWDSNIIINVLKLNKNEKSL